MAISLLLGYDTSATPSDLETGWLLNERSAVIQGATTVRRLEYGHSPRGLRCLTTSPTMAARSLAVGLMAAAVWLAIPSMARAVIVSSGNGNTTGASLTAAGGPGNPAQPGFSNVGVSSSGGSSITYLGNGWAITSGHVPINASPVRFGSTFYNVDQSSITYLQNPAWLVAMYPNNQVADLKMFRLTSDPGLPNITGSLLNTATPSGRVVMIGNGRSITPTNAPAQEYWNVNKSNPNSWVWTATGAPGSPGPNDYSGFDFNTGNTIRWGENTVVPGSDVLVNTTTGPNNAQLSAIAFRTIFDSNVYPTLGSLPNDPTYSANNALASEAQATTGDSGGGVFVQVGGQWKLTGIMVAASSGGLSNEPGTPWTALYGDTTYITDLSYYRDQILAIAVPEPSSTVLMVQGGLTLAMLLALGVRLRRARAA